MRAVRLSAPRQVECVEVAEPRPGPREVLVHIEACGVCGSDLNAWRGVPGIEFPIPAGAPGHETRGSVAALSPDVVDQQKQSGAARQEPVDKLVRVLSQTVDKITT